LKKGIKQTNLFVGFRIPQQNTQNLRSHCCDDEIDDATIALNR
jgi:hypothetical protein